MYYRFFGQRNPEKDIERILVDLKGSDEAGRFATYFVPVMRGWNDDTAAYVDLSQAAQGGIVMNDTEDIYGWGSFMTPAGWTGIITIVGVFRTVAGSGNCYMRSFIESVDGFSPAGYGNKAGSFDTIAGAGIGAYKVTPGVSKDILEQSLVRVYTYRKGSDANDTYDTTIYFLGWEITHTLIDDYYSIVPTFHAKAMTLWNGSGNDAPPANWNEIGYDDSAWNDAIEIVFSYTRIPGAMPIGYSQPSQSSSEQTLLRYKITLPKKPASASLILDYDDILYGWYVNANLVHGPDMVGEPGAGDPLGPFTYDVTDYLVEGDNILSYWTEEAGGGGTQFFAFKLSV